MQPQPDRDTTDAAPVPQDGPPLGSIYTDDRVAQPHVDRLLRTAGIEVRYPLPTLDVLKLFAEMGYSCDLADLHRWCGDPRFAAIAPPRDENGAPQWLPRHVYALLGRLEGDRRWQPLHPLHAAKCSIVARLAAEAVADGYQPEDAVHDLAEHSLRDLLLLVARCDDAAVRMALVDTALLKAAAKGWDSDER